MIPQSQQIKGLSKHDSLVALFRARRLVLLEFSDAKGNIPWHNLHVCVIKDKVYKAGAWRVLSVCFISILPMRIPCNVSNVLSLGLCGSPIDLLSELFF